MCAAHYSRFKRHGSTDDPRPTDEERFWSKVDKSGDCWLWTAGISGGTGYANFHWLGRTQSAHRVSYMLAVGPVPEGMTLDHLCRVRHCVNPSHLEPVTLAENIRRTLLTPELRAARADAGRRGAAARWGSVEQPE